LWIAKGVITVIKEEKTSIIGIGIDQGIANCGYGLVKLDANDQIHVLDSGTIITESSEMLPQRILLLYEKITSLIHETEIPISIIGCEKLFFNPVQKKTGKPQRNKSASIVYTNMATGLLCLIAGQQGVPLKEFVPGTVKKYVAGHGRADKELVEESILQYLDYVPKTSHESDGIAIGITAVKYYRELQMKMKKESS